jgi:pre-rRNA-processing protein IPI3
LYNAWDAHYRQVTVLRFTHDGAALISGSEDSGVIVWLISRFLISVFPVLDLVFTSFNSLVDDDLQNDFPVPYCGLSDHTLSITDIVCGAGSFPRCRVLTSSVDAYVKLWDLSSRTNPLLVTFQFPKPISCLAWDLTERFFFAASRDDDGSIHQMDLLRQREDGLGIEAVGGTDVGHIERVGLGESDTAKKNKRLMLAG